jgi:hypothetical protein
MNARSRWRDLGIGVALALATGCSSPSEVQVTEQELVAVGFLVPGRDTEVRVRRTVVPERYSEGLEDSLAGATVEIEHDGRTYALAEDREEPGTYRIDATDLPVVSGETYRLRVESEGRELRAATTVPGPLRITEVSEDTIVYHQEYGDLYGELVHPGQFRWSASDGAAGYVVIVDDPEIRTLDETSLPLTGDLDALIRQRLELANQVSADSLAALDRRIEALRRYLAENVSLVRAPGDTIHWLRDREQKEWDELEGKENWSEGHIWRERLDRLFWSSRVDYFVPVDSLRSDYWWVGVRFEGECRVRVQAADRSYLDYYATAQNGMSGNDGDKGPIFHGEGGYGVFGSYTEDAFQIIARRSDDGVGLKVSARP